MVGNVSLLSVSGIHCLFLQLFLCEANSKDAHDRLHPRQHIRYQTKGVVTRNIHMKYHIPFTYISNTEGPT